MQGHLQDAKDEYRVDNAEFVFSTWKVANMDARMRDARGQALLRAQLEQGQNTLRINFLHERAPDKWVVANKFWEGVHVPYSGQGPLGVHASTHVLAWILVSVQWNILEQAPRGSCNMHFTFSHSRISLPENAWLKNVKINDESVILR